MLRKVSPTSGKKAPEVVFPSTAADLKSYNQTSSGLYIKEIQVQDLHHSDRSHTPRAAVLLRAAAAEAHDPSPIPQAGDPGGRGPQEGDVIEIDYVAAVCEASADGTCVARAAIERGRHACSTVDALSPRCVAPSH